MTVQAFDSFEDLDKFFAEQQRIMQERTTEDLDRFFAEQQRIMQERTTPVQWEVKEGDKFFYDSGYGFLIFGEVLETYTDEHLKGYVMTRAFSEACPDGEMGDVCRCNIIGLMTPRLYDKIRKSDLDKEFIDILVKNAIMKGEAWLIL